MKFKPFDSKKLSGSKSVNIDDLCMYKVTMTFLGTKQDNLGIISESISSFASTIDLDEKIPEEVTIEVSDVTLNDITKSDPDWEVYIDDEPITIKKIVSSLKKTK